MKAQATEKEKWNCDKCRTEKVRVLQGDLQNALRQIDELKAENGELEEKLLHWRELGRGIQCMQSKRL